MRTDELVKFETQLRPLWETLRGSAELSTLEAQLFLRLAGDARGQVELRGEVAENDCEPAIHVEFIPEGAEED